MKNELVQIVVLLDRSGSMQAVREATIDGFNEFVNGQKQVSGEANLLLVQFDGQDPYEVVFDKPLNYVPNLTAEIFVPRGNTPLHDAMGRTINETGSKLSLIPDADRPGKVIFVVLTDGKENASKEFTQQKVADMVQHQRDKYQWEFIFLGANQDAVLTAKGFNIPARSSLTYTHNPHHMRVAMRKLTSATASARIGKSINFSDQDRKESI